MTEGSYQQPRRHPVRAVSWECPKKQNRRRPTYSRVASCIQNIDTALGGQGLRAGYDALGAVHHASPAGEFLDYTRPRRVDGRGCERHCEVEIVVNCSRRGQCGLLLYRVPHICTYVQKPTQGARLRTIRILRKPNYKQRESPGVNIENARLINHHPRCSVPSPVTPQSAARLPAATSLSNRCGIPTAEGPRTVHLQLLISG